MGRLTTDKSVKEMWAYELAHNCCYAKDGVARYRDFDTDIDAREFARNLMRAYGLWKAGEDKELVDDELFDEVMLENLMHGTDELSGLIALFYCGMWAQADLYETLKGYENTGLTQQEVRMEHDGCKGCRYENYGADSPVCVDHVKSILTQLPAASRTALINTRE